MKPKIKNFLSLTKTYLTIQINKNLAFFLGLGLSLSVAYWGLNRVSDVVSSSEPILNNALSLAWGVTQLLVAPCMVWGYKKSKNQKISSTCYKETELELQQQLTSQKEALFIAHNKSALENAIPVPALKSKSSQKI